MTDRSFRRICVFSGASPGAAMDDAPRAGGSEAIGVIPQLMADLSDAFIALRGRLTDSPLRRMTARAPS